MIFERPESAPIQTELPVSLTAGQMIRAARLQKGLHIAVLSVKLKVSARQLEALESDQYDMAKGPVFVRALASSVCRHLHMDPAPVLALLPPAPDRMPLQRQSLQSLTTVENLSPDFKTFFHAIPRQTLAIAGLMVALTAALIWMPAPASWFWFKSESQALAPTSPMLPPVSEATSSTIDPAPSASEPSLSSATTPALTQTTSASPDAPSLPVPLTPSSSLGQFAFSARHESWIEIRDGKNLVLWSRVLQAGQSAEVQFPLPLNVVVGRAREVDVTFKGKPFDLAPHTKVTVARFEVKE